MSLYGAMFAGVSGLSAQSQALGMISDNISNVNTIGYKGTVARFSTLVTQQATTSSHAPGGVQSTPNPLFDRQGLLQSSDSSTDIAISGNGFFVVNSSVDATNLANGENLFTRAGSFTIDANQNLVNTGGYYLMGWEKNTAGQYIDKNNSVITPDPTSTEDLQVVNLGGLDFNAKGTANISMTANLPSTAKIGDAYTSSVQVYDKLGGTQHVEFDWLKIDDIDFSGPLDHTSPPGAGTITQVVTDSAGSAHTVTFDFTYDAINNNWDVAVSANGQSVAVTGFTIVPGTTTIKEITIDWAGSAKDSTMTLDFGNVTQTSAGGTSAVIALNPNGSSWKMTAKTDDTADSIGTSAAYVLFNTNGTLNSPTNYTFTIDWDDADTFAANSTINFKLGTSGELTGVTSLGDTYQISAISQDGVAFGAFSGVTIDTKGNVNAQFDNGQSLTIFQVPIAKFNNPNGLTARTGNAFLATTDSGSFFLNTAGAGGAGKIAPGSLEASTVDLASEFTTMITTQRAYSASTRIITTANEMLEELVQIIR